jgi:hypothetical protein
MLKISGAVSSREIATNLNPFYLSPAGSGRTSKVENAVLQGEIACLDFWGALSLKQTVFS